MPIFFTREHITNLDVDAIVSFGKAFPVIGDEIEKEIYSVAGYNKLLKAREELGLIVQGEAKFTEGFDTKADYIIHAAANKKVDAYGTEQVTLRNAIRNSLRVAKELKVGSLAIPFYKAKQTLLSEDWTCNILVDEINRIIHNDDITIFLNIYEHIDSSRVVCKKELRGSLVNSDRLNKYRERLNQHVEIENFSNNSCYNYNFSLDVCGAVAQTTFGSSLKLAKSLGELIKHKKADFSDAVIEIMRKKDLSSAEVYNRANIDRRYFSKILNRQVKNPSKNTVLAIVIGLQLDCSEAVALMSLAGYGYNPSDETDIIVFYNIEKGNYDIVKINIDLYDFGKESLGSSIQQKDEDLKKSITE